MKLNSIDWVRKYYYNIKVDEYGNRLSHIVSNMPKIYRKDLKIDGEEVVEIDINASQPSFLCLLFEKGYRLKFTKGIFEKYNNEKYMNYEIDDEVDFVIVEALMKQYKK